MTGLTHTGLLNTTLSGRDRRAEPSAISGRKYAAYRRRSRKLAADCLKAAFPSRSENELCQVAAPVLGVSENTVRRILREETDARFSLIWPLLAMGAASTVIATLEPDQ